MQLLSRLATYLLPVSSNEERSPLDNGLPWALIAGDVEDVCIAVRTPDIHGPLAAIQVVTPEVAEVSGGQCIVMPPDWLEERDGGAVFIPNRSKSMPIRFKGARLVNLIVTEGSGTRRLLALEKMDDRIRELVTSSRSVLVIQIDSSGNIHLHHAHSTSDARPKVKDRPFTYRPTPEIGPYSRYRATVIDVHHDVRHRDGWHGVAEVRTLDGIPFKSRMGFALEHSPYFDVGDAFIVEIARYGGDDGDYTIYTARLSPHQRLDCLSRDLQFDAEVSSREAFPILSDAARFIGGRRKEVVGLGYADSVPTMRKYPRQWCFARNKIARISRDKLPTPSFGVGFDFHDPAEDLSDEEQDAYLTYLSPVRESEQEDFLASGHAFPDLGANFPVPVDWRAIRTVDGVELVLPGHAIPPMPPEHAELLVLSSPMKGREGATSPILLKLGWEYGALYCYRILSAASPGEVDAIRSQDKVVVVLEADSSGKSARSFEAQVFRQKPEKFFKV